MWLLLLLILKTLPITQAAAPPAMTQVPSRHLLPHSAQTLPSQRLFHVLQVKPAAPLPAPHRLLCHCFISFTAPLHVLHACLWALVPLGMLTVFGARWVSVMSAEEQPALQTLLVPPLPYLQPLLLQTEPAAASLKLFLLFRCLSSPPAHYTPFLHWVNPFSSLKTQVRHHLPWEMSLSNAPGRPSACLCSCSTGTFWWLCSSLHASTTGWAPWHRLTLSPGCPALDVSSPHKERDDSQVLTVGTSQTPLIRALRKLCSLSPGSPDPGPLRAYLGQSRAVALHPPVRKTGPAWFLSLHSGCSPGAVFCLAWPRGLTLIPQCPSHFPYTSEAPINIIRAVMLQDSFGIDVYKLAWNHK